MLRIRQRYAAGTGMANGGRKEGKKTVARAAGRCASLAPFRPRGFAVGALRRSGPEKGRPSSPARPWGCPRACGRIAWPKAVRFRARLGLRLCARRPCAWVRPSAPALLRSQPVRLFGFPADLALRAELLPPPFAPPLRLRSVLLCAVLPPGGPDYKTG